MGKTVLGWTSSNTRDTVRAKFKRKALLTHPNKGGARNDFEAVYAAWEAAQRYYDNQNARRHAPRPAANHRARPTPRPTPRPAWNRESPAAPRPANNGSCPNMSHQAKYATRPPPPRPANAPGCHGKVFMGNDGTMYISKPNVAGVYSWKKLK